MADTIYATLQKGDNMKQRKKRKLPGSVMYKNAVGLWETLEQNKTDPNGSYTGRPEQAKETPVQDADDL